MILYDLIVLILTLIVSIRKPHHFRRLFAPIPKPNGKEVIWIHAVSVGEAKSVQSLFHSLRAENPAAFFLITATTSTGLAEARRSLPAADAFAYMPIDIRPIVRRWASKLRPKLFILVESDFWPNLLAAIKKHGGKTLLVSGKISERSAARFAAFSYFSKKLFDRIDLLSVQNTEHAQRFLPLVEPAKIKIGGNLKLDHRPLAVDAAYWRQKLSISDPAITLACTHAPEEEELLSLLPLDRYCLFLAPRHPERFDEVAALLQRRNIPFIRWTQIDQKRGGERVILVDAMGQLPICYALSRLAIVAGSFAPHVGGHNILEPCLYGVPVFFGPHTHGQKELTARVLAAKAGIQTPYATLPAIVESFFSTPKKEDSMRAAAAALIESGRGATASTLQIIHTFLEKV